MAVIHGDPGTKVALFKKFPDFQEINSPADIGNKIKESQGSLIDVPTKVSAHFKKIERETSDALKALEEKLPKLQSELVIILAEVDEEIRLTREWAENEERIQTMSAQEHLTTVTKNVRNALNKANEDLEKFIDRQNELIAKSRKRLNDELREVRALSILSLILLPRTYWHYRKERALGIKLIKLNQKSFEQLQTQGEQQIQKRVDQLNAIKKKVSQKRLEKVAIIREKENEHHKGIKIHKSLITSHRKDIKLLPLKEKQEQAEASSIIQDEIKLLQIIQEALHFKGWVGEHAALEELRKLDDSFHVICDLQLELPKWRYYSGSRDLKSAQIDFVVVGKTGIYLIEVKNWSDEYQHTGLPPWEQVDRAANVLYRYLKDRTGKRQHVKRLIVSVHNNITRNEAYPHVYTCDINLLSRHITNGKGSLSKTEIDTVLTLLQQNLTKNDRISSLPWTG